MVLLLWSRIKKHWITLPNLWFQRYVENVKQDTNIGTNILRVSASDEDADNNGAIRYSLTAPGDPSDLDYFDIQPESGWIFLTKPLDVSPFNTILHSPNNILLINDILYFFIHLYMMVK